MPDRTDISRGRAAISHPCVSQSSKIFATCFGVASSDAVLQACHVHHRPHCCTMFHHQCFCSNSWPIEDVGGLSHPLHPCASNSIFQALFSFSRRNKTQLACYLFMHYRCQSYRSFSVAFDSFSRGSIFQKDQFLNSGIPSGP